MIRQLIRKKRRRRYLTNCPHARRRTVGFTLASSLFGSFIHISHARRTCVSIQIHWRNKDARNYFLDQSIFSPGGTGRTAIKSIRTGKKKQGKRHKNRLYALVFRSQHLEISISVEQLEPPPPQGKDGRRFIKIKIGLFNHI